MPFGADQLAEIAGLIIAAASGGFGVAKLHGRSTTSASSGGDAGDETLRAIERVSLKVEHVSRVLGQVQLSIGGLATDVDEIKHDVERLKPVVADAIGRLAALESRALPTPPAGPT